MGPFEMVVAIVGIGAVASVAKAKYGHGSVGRRGRRDRQALTDENWGDAGQSDLATENRRLHDELRGLKERIQVLERLATDDDSDARRLDREIEKLRERPAVSTARPPRDI